LLFELVQDEYSPQIEGQLVEDHVQSFPCSSHTDQLVSGRPTVNWLTVKGLLPATRAGSASRVDNMQGGLEEKGSFAPGAYGLQLTGYHPEDLLSGIIHVSLPYAQTTDRSPHVVSVGFN
jgi:hypothetical protein